MGWNADGHKLDVKLSVWSSGRITGPAPLRHCGQLDVTVECPEGSVCRRDETERPDHCFVREEMQALGVPDFIEVMEVGALPSDWSSRFPVVIEWRDRGEDGVDWRPAGADA